MLPRFHVGDELALNKGHVCELPADVSRHVQVLRMQPGGEVHLFDGRGHEVVAVVTEMGRKLVTVEVGDALAQTRELPVRVTLAIGMPANDRMDALIEKAAELGVHAIQPLLCERSVLRLDGERATKKVAHWQAVAVSACEQSGRAVVPQVHVVKSLNAWLAALPQAAGLERRGVLSLREAVSLRTWVDAGLAPDTGADASSNNSAAPDTGGIAAVPSSPSYMLLSGPEGGLSPAEEALALHAGWQALTLGPRVLRADTAPLAALSVIGSVYEA